MWTICVKVLIRILNLIEPFAPTKENITPNTIKTQRIFSAKSAVSYNISVAYVFLIWGGISLIKTHELISSVLPDSAQMNSL